MVNGYSEVANDQLQLHTQAFIHGAMDISFESLKQLALNYEFWESTQGNGIVIGAVGMILAGSLFLRITTKSSISSAILACFLLSIVGSIFFVALVIVVVGLLCLADRSNRKVVVVSRY